MVRSTVWAVQDRRAAVRQAAGTVLVAAGVLAAAPRPAQAWQTLRAPGDALDPTAPLLALVALAVWALAGWLLLAVLLAAAARLPGAVGRVADALAARTVPRSVRRVTGVLLGAGLVLGIAAPAGAAEPAVGSRADVVVSLDWPVVTAGSGTSPGADPDSSPGAGPETGPVARPGTSPSAVPRTTVAADDRPGAATASPSPPGRTATAAPPTAASPTTGAVPVVTPPTRAATEQEAVVVRPGDSLWALAERGLRAQGTAEPSNAQVAAAWPSWWSANREVVGDDPHLLLPGTRLVTPPD